MNISQDMYVVLQCSCSISCVASVYIIVMHIFFSDFTIGKHEKFLATSKQRLKSPRGKDVALSKHSNSFKVSSPSLVPRLSPLCEGRAWEQGYRVLEDYISGIYT